MSAMDEISEQFSIETERLLIRRFSSADIDAFHAIFGDERVMRHIPSGVSADREASRLRLARIMEQVERTGLGLWAVVDKSSGQVIGDCGLFPVEGTGPEVEVAYHFSPGAWGKGYATEAAIACIRYGFENAGLEKIVALVLPENQASVRVIEKAGLIYQGTAYHYNLNVHLYMAEAATWNPAGNGGGKLIEP